tara:strand:- start:87 stop:251 length:165 start_codon:yes stop_codon:yes gene_type:complete
MGRPTTHQLEKPMRIVIMERKVKVKRCEAVAGLNTIATDQILSMGELYRHGHSD